MIQIFKKHIILYDIELQCDSNREFSYNRYLGSLYIAIIKTII